MPKAKATNTTIPSAASQCPVMPIVSKMEGIWEAHCELDIEFQGTQHPIGDAMRELWNARDTLKELASLTRATSVEGALFQVGLLYDLVNDMFEAIGDMNNQSVLTPQRNSANRLAYSIAGVLGGMVGELEAKRLTGKEMPANHDTMRVMDAAIANESVAEFFPQSAKRPSPAVAS